MQQFLFACRGIVLAACLLGSVPAKAQNESAGEPQLAFILDDAGEAQELTLLRGKARILRLVVDVRDVLVANPDIADVVIRTPRLIYVLGREVGDTNVFFFDDGGNEILRLNVRVELDLGALRAVLEQVLPDEDVRVSAVDQNIILTGRVTSAKVVDDVRELSRRFVAGDANIINMLDVDAEQQVLLRVRVAEMQRSALKELGLNFSFIRSAGNFTRIGFNVTNPISGGSGSVFADFLTANTNFTALIDALERNGLVKTLAEPNLTAVSGETANFLAGGEFPIPVAQEEGTITIEFKPFGIGLDFTPVVLSSGRISLRVQTEVSGLTTRGAVTIGGISVSGLSVRRAATTVELPSGGSLVIAGLLQDDISNTIEGVPGLKDVPILGALFRSVRFQRDETELVIAVTVYLVRPVDAQQIVFPTDGFAPASDIDMYFFGRIHATYAKGAAMPSLAELKAPIGYILE